MVKFSFNSRFIYTFRFAGNSFADLQVTLAFDCGCSSSPLNSLEKLCNKSVLFPWQELTCCRFRNAHDRSTSALQISAACGGDLLRSRELAYYCKKLWFFCVQINTKDLLMCEFTYTLWQILPFSVESANNRMCMSIRKKRQQIFLEGKDGLPVLTFFLVNTLLYSLR